MAVLSYHKMMVRYFVNRAPSVLVHVTVSKRTFLICDLLFFECFMFSGDNNINKLITLHSSRHGRIVTDPLAPLVSEIFDLKNSDTQTYTQTEIHID